MQRKFLLTVLFIVLLAALIYKSPFAANYNYNKAKALCNQGKYEQSIPYFEKSLFANPNSTLTRFFYAKALANTKPTYSVQKKLYEIAESKIDDQAKRFAQSQLGSIRRVLLRGLEYNYINNAVQSKDVIRWDYRKFPLKYYIEASSDMPAYYTEAITSAMGQWQSRTNFIKFQGVNNPSDANILIDFKDNNAACNQSGLKYVVANTTPIIRNNNFLDKMELTFNKTDPCQKVFSRQEIYTTALHELGHTLGIMGHSDNPADIMYSAQEGNGRKYSIFGNQRLSDRDVKTLVLLYRMKPTVTNTANLESENFYYAPLILGNSDIQAQKKIAELQQYISKYPNIANGYINLGATYADMGSNQNAIQYLNKAETLANTEEEKFLVAYNKAMVYFNMQDLKKSYEYAVKAQSIKDDPSLTELLNEIQKMAR